MPFGVKPVCVSCNISSSPIWRKGPQGEVLCNSCGIKQANGSSLYGVNIKENGVVNGGKKTDAQSSGNLYQGRLHVVAWIQSGGSPTSDSPDATGWPCVSRRLWMPWSGALSAQ